MGEAARRRDSALWRCDGGHGGAVAWAVVSAATGGEVAQRRGGAAAERAGRGGGGEVGGRAVAAFLLEHTRTHSTQSARARAP